ncbi:MAG: methyltransferase domain-containing protein [Planctomycetaceae bacterium]|nr:methyltransferase domain-containing protein [Planctomycetaceae bacterium]
MTIRSYVIGQFKNPHGLVGHLAGWIMAKRGSNRERNSWTVELLDVQPTDRILEIGCGPGLALQKCARLATDGHVVGVDHSPTMLWQARSRNEQSIKAGRVELRLGDLAILKTFLEPFDKVLSANVAQFFQDKAVAYRQIFAITAPGGTVATTYLPRSKNPSRRDALKFAENIKKYMASSGFVEIRIEELPLDPTPAVCIIGEHP